MLPSFWPFFVRRALGDYAGLVVGWSDWISTCGTTAAVSIDGEYALVLFPTLRGIEPAGLTAIGVLLLTIPLYLLVRKK